MAIHKRVLEAAAIRGRTLVKSFTMESWTPSKGSQTAFLSHSTLDKDLAVGLQVLLHEAGWEVYIDWQHNELFGDRPTIEHSKELQRRMQQCEWFIYLATENSSKSRWCPWEIGFANAKKGDNAIVVVQTSDDRHTYGSEYLNLYRHIDISSVGQKAQLHDAGPHTRVRDLKYMPRSPAGL